MSKRATAIRLNEQEQKALTRLVRRHRSEQQVALRARIVLAAAQGSSNIQIARELDIDVDTVRLWNPFLVYQFRCGHRSGDRTIVGSNARRGRLRRSSPTPAPRKPNDGI
jgi:FixJ family two-component response regulator